MRGDEERVIRAFCRWLEDDGWTVEREVAFVDVLATRQGQRLYAEAKGRTTSPGLDTDTMFGQLLRRMPVDEVGHATFAVVLPNDLVRFAERVPARVRQLLTIAVYGVSDEGVVSGPT